MTKTRALQKEKRETWFFRIGMLDAYDYIVGKHPNTPDDENNIEDWADDIQRQISSWGRDDDV